MPYNFNVGPFLYFKCFKSNSGLKVIGFNPIDLLKKFKVLNSKRKLLKMYKNKRSQPS